LALFSALTPISSANALLALRPPESLVVNPRAGRLAGGHLPVNESPPMLKTPQRAAFVQLTAAFLAVAGARSWLAPPPLEGHQREAGHTADGHAQDADQLRGGQLHK
jgi:hypothetical protein